MRAALGALCWGAAVLVAPSGAKDARPDSASVPADSAAVTEGPVIHSISYSVSFAHADSLRLWPPGMDEAVSASPLAFRARERGLGGAAMGELAPTTPGLVWHGLPLEWPLETGGDLTLVSGAACATMTTSRLPLWLGDGLGTIGVAPWESVAVSPLTSVHVLRGDHNDRSYSVGLSTGVSSRVFSLLAVSLSKGDGARTNADYSRTQYDVRLDLRPPALSACRVTAQRGEVARGDPGPDPRLWPSDDGPLSPRYWAIGQGYGAADAMWAHDRESLTKSLLAVQLEHLVRGRRLGAALVEEAIDATLSKSVPTLVPAPFLRRAAGDLAVRRRAILVRIPLVDADEESLWAGLGVERLRRNLAVEWTAADSAWRQEAADDLSRSRLALGMGLAGLSASLTATSSSVGTRFSWGVSAARELAGFRAEAGGAGASYERGVFDLWQACLASDEAPRSKGRVGTAWLSLGRELRVGDLTVGGVAGWGSGVWGWCDSESLPPAHLRRWGPESCTAWGAIAAWRFSPVEGVRAEAWLRTMPWDAGDHPVPGWPRTSGALRVSLSHAIGRAATPSVDIIARRGGIRYADAEGVLPLDAYWQVDAHAGVEIGDFTVRVLLENLTGARHEDERGYPVEGLRLRAGFSWLFWD